MLPAVIVDEFAVPSKEFLNKCYPTLPHIAELLHSQPKDEKDLIENYMTSKIWRLNNLYVITDTNGKERIFHMNEAQHKVYSEILYHHRLIILKSRQQGISTLWLVSFFDDALFNKNFKIGLMAIGKDSTKKLLERTKLMWERMPDWVLTLLNITRKLEIDNADEIQFSNKSTIYIQTSFRSGTLQRLHISELAKVANKKPEAARETLTGSIQTIHGTNQVIIESTAEGENMFSDMWWKYENKDLDTLGNKDFKCVFLSWLDDPKCKEAVFQKPIKESIKYFEELEKSGVIATQEQKNWWIMQFIAIGREIFKEYPATAEEAFMSTLDGSYYHRIFRENILFKNRVMSNLYDHNLPVICAFDLGADDYTVIGFFQVHNRECRLLHEYVDYAKEADLEIYAQYIQKSEYKDNIKQLILPHDGNVTELGTGMTRADRLRQMGFAVDVEKKKSVVEGIDSVRHMLKNMYIDPQCDYTISCLKGYSKEWDNVRQMWKNKPLHDEKSHGADMLRVFAMNNPSLWYKNTANNHKKVMYQRIKTNSIAL